MADAGFDNVSKRFGGLSAVTNLTLHIPDASFVVLLGPTGAGKTTTLRLMAGLETADEGNIRIGGIDVTRWSPPDRNVAMVFQHYSLYPHLSVRDNLAFPLRSPRLAFDDSEVAARVQEIAALLRIDQKLDNRATELSGGEMQRVSIGRALVRKPSIFLMDEPLSSLDAKLRAELRVELKRIQADVGATVLYVTHDQVEAMTMATHVGVLHEGRLVQYGSPREVYENPNSIYVASRLGQPRINIVSAGLFSELSQPTAAASIGLRPEHILINSNTSASVQGRIETIEYLGDQIRAAIRIKSTKISTLLDGSASFRVGQDVDIRLANPLFFDSAGNRIQSFKDG